MFRCDFIVTAAAVHFVFFSFSFRIIPLVNLITFSRRFEQEFRFKSNGEIYCVFFSIDLHINETELIHTGVYVCRKQRKNCVDLKIHSFIFP